MQLRQAAATHLALLLVRLLGVVCSALLGACRRLLIAHFAIVRCRCRRRHGLGALLGRHALAPMLGHKLRAWQRRLVGCVLHAVRQPSSPQCTQTKSTPAEPQSTWWHTHHVQLAGKAFVLAVRKALHQLPHHLHGALHLRAHNRCTTCSPAVAAGRSVVCPFPPLPSMHLCSHYEPQIPTPPPYSLDTTAPMRPPTSMPHLHRLPPKQAPCTGPGWTAAASPASPRAAGAEPAWRRWHPAPPAVPPAQPCAPPWCWSAQQRVSW